MTPSPKTIGSMNGPWALTLKIMLASYPIVVTAMLAWGSWVTVGQIRDEARHERFLKIETLCNESSLAIAAMPSPASTSAKLDSLIQAVADLRVTASTNSTKLQAIDQRTQQLVAQFHDIETGRK